MEDLWQDLLDLHNPKSLIVVQNQVVPNLNRCVMQPLIFRNLRRRIIAASPRQAAPAAPYGPCARYSRFESGQKFIPCCVVKEWCIFLFPVAKFGVEDGREPEESVLCSIERNGVREGERGRA